MQKVQEAKVILASILGTGYIRQHVKNQKDRPVRQEKKQQPKFYWLEYQTLPTFPLKMCRMSVTPERRETHLSNQLSNSNKRWHSFLRKEIHCQYTEGHPKCLSSTFLLDEETRLKVRALTASRRQSRDQITSGAGYSGRGKGLRRAVEREAALLSRDLMKKTSTFMALKNEPMNSQECLGKLLVRKG